MRSDYITGGDHVSYRYLAEKYGVARSTVYKRGRREKWVEGRRKYRDDVVKKAVRKQTNKEATILAKEMTLLDKIEEHLDRAISDVEQFNKYIVQDAVGKGVTKTEERIFSKADIRAMKEAMQTLQMIERMRTEREDRENGRTAAITIRFTDDSNEWGE